MTLLYDRLAEVLKDESMLSVRYKVKQDIGNGRVYWIHDIYNKNLEYKNTSQKQRIASQQVTEKRKKCDAIF